MRPPITSGPTNCLEPTYEGLKQVVLGTRQAAEDRLEPTYEGLKRFQLRSMAQTRAGLEPTYEGLKPELRSRCVRNSMQVWSLPMRD